ncbi:hypothetical protein AVEN_237129-1, partial [Araneus ventricosus]
VNVDTWIQKHPEPRRQKQATSKGNGEDSMCIDTNMESRFPAMKLTVGCDIWLLALSWCSSSD